MRPPARALRKAEIEREGRPLPADQSTQPLRTPRCTGISEWKGGAADTALRRTIRHGVATSGGRARAGSLARERSQSPRTRRLGGRRGRGTRAERENGGHALSTRWKRACPRHRAVRGRTDKHPNTGNAHVETMWEEVVICPHCRSLPPPPAGRVETAYR